MGWCWDYERGFLSVTGGVVRVEPVDLSKMPPEEVTQVDKHISTWFHKEIARKLGVKVADIQDSVGAGESLAMRGMRMLVQKEAKEKLEEADKEGRAISDADVLATLKRWPFARNIYRQNVMPRASRTPSHMMVAPC